VTDGHKEWCQRRLHDERNTGCLKNDPSLKRYSWRDEKLIKSKSKHTWQNQTCKLYSTVFWVFLPNIINIDRYNFELYRFKIKVGSFFETRVHIQTQLLSQLIRLSIIGRYINQFWLIDWLLCGRWWRDVVDVCVFSDKTDSSFSQSHSSSMTSLDNINKEAIQCLVFTDAYARKAGTHDTHTGLQISHYAVYWCPSLSAPCGLVSVVE